MNLDWILDANQDRTEFDNQRREWHESVCCRIEGVNALPQDIYEQLFRRKDMDLADNFIRVAHVFSSHAYLREYSPYAEAIADGLLRFIQAKRSTLAAGDHFTAAHTLLLYFQYRALRHSALAHQQNLIIHQGRPLDALPNHLLCLDFLTELGPLRFVNPHGVITSFRGDLRYKRCLATLLADIVRLFYKHHLVNDQLIDLSMKTREFRHYAGLFRESCQELIGQDFNPFVYCRMKDTRWKLKLMRYGNPERVLYEIQQQFPDRESRPDRETDYFSLRETVSYARCLAGADKQELLTQLRKDHDQAESGKFHHHARNLRTFSRCMLHEELFGC